MEKGFNSDLFIRGEKYHVQTEDWGEKNSCIITRVFKNGAVVKTRKTSYQEVLSGPKPNLRHAIFEQHQEVIEELKNQF